MLARPVTSRLPASIAIAAALAAFGGGACKGKDKAGATAGAGSGSAIGVASGSDSATVPDAVAAAAAADTSTVEGLWAAYQAAHVGATTANAIETGRKIWELLSSESRTMVGDAASSMLGASTIKVAISAEDLGYKILGEGAAVRQAFMASATIAENVPHPDQELGGTVVSRHSLTIRGTGADPLTLEVARAGASAQWRLAPSPSLVADTDDVFRAPAGDEKPAGVATLDALAARWKEILATGNGWDAYNLMSASMRTQLLDMIASMGGSGAGDVAKVFEKTIVDRRTRGITVSKTAIEDRTADRASIMMTYSDGKADRFVGVRVDGAWWLEMPL